MPVVDERQWVHVRVRKILAHKLRAIAKRFHRYGIQTEANLAIEEYIRKNTHSPRDNGK